MSNNVMREASDPATPAARIRALWLSDDIAHEDDPIEVAMALMRHPALPLDILLNLLEFGNEQAWYNPGVAILLQGESRSSLERLACCC